MTCVDCRSTIKCRMPPIGVDTEIVRFYFNLGFNYDEILASLLANHNILAERPGNSALEGPPLWIRNNGLWIRNNGLWIRNNGLAVITDCESVITDCESVITDCESVITDCESVITDCESVITDCESVITDCESVITDCESVITDCESVITDCFRNIQPYAEYNINMYMPKLLPEKPTRHTGCLPM